MTPLRLPVAELKPALTGLSKVIPTKSTLPVLHHLKVERSADGWIAITATDLDRFVTVRLEHPSEGEPATILVPFEQLQQLVKSSNKDEQLHLVPHPQQPVIRFSLGGQLGESFIKPLPVSEFPPTPRITPDPIPLTPELRCFLQEAMSCCSVDGSKPALNGVCLDVSHPKGSYVVATDGRHLYSANSFTLPLKQSLLIPGHKFLVWKDFCLDGEWQLRADAQYVQIRSRRWRFVSRLIQHPYPDWKAVVPTPDSTKTHLTLDPDQLGNLTSIIQRLPDADDRYHSLGLQWDGKALSLLAKDPTQAKWTQVAVENTHGRGPAQTVMFDRRFLLKALNYGLNQISLIDERSPLRFSHQGRQLIVMPVRVEESPSQVQESRPENTIPIKPTHHLMPPNPMPHPPENSSSSAAIIDEALAMCGTLRDRFQEGLNQLRDLGSKLKLVQREQKSSAKEINSVRSTLRTLQGLKL